LVAVWALELPLELPLESLEPLVAVWAW